MDREPTRIFISYSHKDERLRNALGTHLSMLRRSGLIAEWYDRKIEAGTEFREEIELHLAAAEIILLLVSPDFLASEYCYSIELARAMEQHESGASRVIPIILRPADWEDTAFSKLLALPTDGKPVTTWANRDSAFLSIAEGIKSAISYLPKPETIPKSSAVDPFQDPTRFGGSILQVGGIGSRLVTKTAYLLDEHGYLPANEYIST